MQIIRYIGAVLMLIIILGFGYLGDRGALTGSGEFANIMMFNVIVAVGGLSMIIDAIISARH